MNVDCFCGYRRYIVFILYFLVYAAAFAQTVTGFAVDMETKTPLIGAQVSVPGTGFSAATDDNGKFSVQSDATHNVLRLECLGYKPVEQRITPSKNGYANLGKGDKVYVGVVEMEMDVVVMKDIIVTSSLGIARKTPVALSNVNSVQVDEKLGGREFPEVLKYTPGVSVTRNGGGFGDSKLNMRGFQSPNVALMINGVPMNDMEWGGLYWSNWSGLSEVVRSVQTHRGLGASKVSAPSVGGSVNIVTRTVEQERGGSFTYGLGDNGMNTISLTLSSGLSDKGWGFTAMGGKSWGDGYVQGTEYEAYNYFIQVSQVP